MMDGYNRLFEEIWTRAVLDDVATVKAMIRKKGRDMAYKVYTERNNEQRINQSDKRFHEIYKDIKDYTDMKIGKLEKRIKKLIFMEAQEWPYNKYLKLNDKEYNDLLDELIKEVEEFSKTRMEKRWWLI